MAKISRQRVNAELLTGRLHAREDKLKPLNKPNPKPAEEEPGRHLPRLYHGKSVSWEDEGE